MFALLGLFNLLMMNLSTTAIEERRLQAFSYRLWDEVSSAWTHVGCALLASIIYSSSQSSAWPGVTSALLYFLVGFLAFHFERPKPSTAADAASPPEISHAKDAAMPPSQLPAVPGPGAPSASAPVGMAAGTESAAP